MKLSTTLTSLTFIGCALAAPISEVISVEKRQFSFPGLGGGSSGMFFCQTPVLISTGT